MAVSFRTSWSPGTESGYRDIYANINPLPGDFLVIFHYKHMDGTESGDDTVYTYDSDNSLNKLGEYSRGGSSEISAYTYDVGNNPSTVAQIHIYVNDGMDQSLAVLAFTGVDTANPIITDTHVGLYYTGETEQRNLASTPNGMYVCGFHTSDPNNYISQTDTLSSFTTALDFDDPNPCFVFYDESSDTMHEATWKQNGNNRDSSGWVITLLPTQPIDMTQVPANLAGTADIGSVDDGNITVKNINVTESISAAIGSIEVAEPLTADLYMGITGADCADAVVIAQPQTGGMAVGLTGE